MSHLAGTFSLAQPEKPIPSWFAPLDKLFQSFTLSNSWPSDKELGFLLLRQSKPLQLFFAGYLQSDLKQNAQYFIKSYNTISSEKVVDALTNARSYLSKHQLVTRDISTAPMTKDQAALAAAEYSKNDPIKLMSAVIQEGTNQYFERINTILVRAYNISFMSDTLEMISTGISSQSFWREMAPFFSLSIAQNSISGEANFQTAFQLAKTNQAFTSYDGQKIRECPARHMIRHLLNTDFIEQPDGTLDIAPNPRSGALPEFIYQKLSACEPIALRRNL